MRKATRLRKAWHRNRNWNFYAHKGIYFCVGKEYKDMPTPKQLCKWLRKESLLDRQQIRKED